MAATPILHILVPVLVGLVALVVIFVILRSMGKRNREVQLTQLGFQPVQEDASARERIPWREGLQGEEVEIQELRLATLEKQPVYHYRRILHRGTTRQTTEELLLPLRRPSPEGLVLVVRPPGATGAIVGTLLEGLMATMQKVLPARLTRLALPQYLAEGAIVAALGPAGTRLEELVDRERLELLQQAGSCGVLLILCQGEWCALASPSGSGKPLRLEECCALVSQLV